ncbi:MAG: hypothetical protein WA741_12750 [Candidatus Sulfotelmatobacter sp.]
MPKRIIDGEGLWRSDKLAEVTPTWIKAEYANLVPLALANGSFEANPRRIWSTVYSYNRPEITLEQVEEVLAEFERVKLLFRWTDGATGKQWGYLVGIEKPGRLPAPSRLRQGHEILGPQPPKELLQKFLANPETTGQPVATQPLPNGSIGFGFCSGLGSGKGDGSPMASQEMDHPHLPERNSDLNSIEIARALCSENGWSGEKMIWALKDAVEFKSKQMPEASLDQVGTWLVRAYVNRRAAKGDFAGGPQKFFEQALYRNYEGENSYSSAGSDNPATRALAQMEGD